MNTTPAKPSGDIRVRRTLKLLRDALLELLEQKGLQDITVQDITERAMINRATFYAHFTDKYDLLEYHIDESFKEKLESAFPESFTLSRDSIRLLILLVIDYLAPLLKSKCKSQYKQFEPIIEAKVQARLYELIIKALHDLPKKVASKNADPEVIAIVFSWSITGAGLEWCKKEERCSVDSLAGQLIDILFKGTIG